MRIQILAIPYLHRVCGVLPRTIYVKNVLTDMASSQGFVCMGNHEPKYPRYRPRNPGSSVSLAGRKRGEEPRRGTEELAKRKV